MRTPILAYAALGLVSACGMAEGGSGTDSRPRRLPPTAPAEPDRDAPVSDGAATGPYPVARDPGSRAGWTIRDDVPYPRSGHTAILDEANDRMVVFGGGANDTWVLPLSGPRANQWSELLVSGEHPPVHIYNGAAGDSAVYDAESRSMIVAVDVTGVDNPRPDVVLWQLSLDEPPAWAPLGTAGAPQLGHPRVALDAAGRRLFVVGDGGGYWSIWSLTLGGTPRWTLLMDTLRVFPGWLPFEDGGSAVVYDAARDRLIISDALTVMALPIGAKTWDQLGFVDRGAVVLDADDERLLISGGVRDARSAPAGGGVTATSLDGAGLSQAPLRTLPGAQPWAAVGASAVLDAKRGRTSTSEESLLRARISRHRATPSPRSPSILSSGPSSCRLRETSHLSPPVRPSGTPFAKPSSRSGTARRRATRSALRSTGGSSRAP